MAKMVPASPFVLLLISISCFSIVDLSVSKQQSTTFNAIFQFGDSLSDTGNFLIANANTNLTVPFGVIPPYGITFFGHPTGRCSDGRLIVDFLAEAFGLPLLPPILSRNSSFERGANFAVTGATALDASFFQERGAGRVLLTNLSLNVQLRRFEQLLPSLCSFPGGCKEYLSRSLFVVGEVGGNDYLLPWAFHLLTQEQVTAYVPTVVDAIKNVTERLIELGAVNLVVPGNPPSGCFSAVLTLLSGPDKANLDPRTGCLRSANDLISYHNRLLRKEVVVKLRRKHPGVRIAYADFYTPIIDFVKSPSKFGFDKETILRACCGGGGGPYNYNQRAICGLPGTSACVNPMAAADWDGWHGTEAMYSRIAASWLDGPHSHPTITSFVHRECVE